MFIPFFYLLRQAGIPVSPTAFLRLQSALQQGLITSLDDFYTAARTILVKNEKHFDLYDRTFAHYFHDAPLENFESRELADWIQDMLGEWLKDPQDLAAALGVDEAELSNMSPQEIVDYFFQRLQDQDGEHHGGNRWIGTRGTSPVGHSGVHPGGMRVGGLSRNQSAIKVAMDRRYKDYAQEGPLTHARVGEALKRLTRLVPEGPKDVLDIDATIRQTVHNAGEIELVFQRSLKDRLKVILAIDNGGWSMEPFVYLVKTLFTHARAHFKDLQILYFHNTIYDRLWYDPPRRSRPVKVDDMVTWDSQTRLIIVGDASMAPYELMSRDGSIHLEDSSGEPSIDRLQLLARSFPYSVWLNPKMASEWPYTRTIQMIRRIFPMFELSMEGLEQAVQYLKGQPGGPGGR